VELSEVTLRKIWLWLINKYRYIFFFHLSIFYAFMIYIFKTKISLHILRFLDQFLGTRRNEKFKIQILTHSIIFLIQTNWSMYTYNTKHAKLQTSLYPSSDTKLQTFKFLFVVRPTTRRIKICERKRKPSCHYCKK
jgi:hypothetical protein